MVKIFTARWLLPISAPPLAHGAVAVQSDQILAVGSLPEMQARFPAASLRDFGEAVILPGIVNVHSHLELTAFRGRLEESQFQRWIASLVQLKGERLTYDDLLMSARLGCLEAIRAGVTTLADTADSAATLAALIESGLRGVVFQECFGPQNDQAEASLGALQQKLAQHRRDLLATKAEARLRLGVSPHAPYSVSARLYEKVASFALTESLDIAIHAAESQDEMKLLRDGTGAFAESLNKRGIAFTAPHCSTVKYFHQLGVLEAAPLLIHCVTVDENDISLMKQFGARVAHCPKSNAKFGHGIAPLATMQANGLRIGLGTDSVASNNTHDLIEEARFGALIHRAKQSNGEVLTPDQLLRMMTIDGARALKLDNQTGSLEAGKQADLIAIDLSHAHNSPHYDPAAAIVFSCSARDVIFTMVAGQTLYENGQVSSLDESEILRAGRIIQEKLALS